MSNFWQWLYIYFCHLLNPCIFNRKYFNLNADKQQTCGAIQIRLAPDKWIWKCTEWVFKWILEFQGLFHLVAIYIAFKTLDNIQLSLFFKHLVLVPLGSSQVYPPTPSWSIPTFWYVRPSAACKPRMARSGSKWLRNCHQNYSHYFIFFSLYGLWSWSYCASIFSSSF